MPIDAVFFDLDDTLIVDEAASRATFAAVAQETFENDKVRAGRFQEAAMELAEDLFREGPCYAYCKEIGISAFEIMWGTFKDERPAIEPDPRLAPLHKWRLPYRQEVWEQALLREGGDLLAGQSGPQIKALQLSDRWAQLRAEHLRDMAGAKELLARLRGNVKLGLLTNGSPSLQRTKIQLAELDPYFDAVAISGEVRIGKPRPGIFIWLCEQCGVEAENAVMVGNSLGRDIKGAQNAGMRSVWIDVPGAHGGDPALIQGDATIGQLGELIEALKTI
ncbi:MAG: HAD family hydrolase [Verrucomicrobiota bacterium]